jgi:uncharacterized membrane protein YjjB (DUF3815 family)
MLLGLGLASAAQIAGQAAYGAPLGGFAGAVTAVLVATVARRLPPGPPALVVFLPAFWLLVPGSLGLLSATQLAERGSDGLGSTIDAIAVVVAIALGVLVGSALGGALERRLDPAWP